MRTKIREAISSAVADVCGLGVAFRTGFLSDLNKGGFALPCVWLCPLDLLRTHGQHEGRKYYAGAMYMLDPNIGLSPEAKDDAWDKMEQQALYILGAAAEHGDDVVAIENIKAVVDEYAYTGFSSISVKVTFEIEMSFCEPR